MLNILMIFIFLAEVWLAWKLGLWSDILTGVFRWPRPLPGGDGIESPDQIEFDKSQQRAKLAMLLLGALFIVVWIVSHLTMLLAMQLLIVSAAGGFAYKNWFQGHRPTSVMFGFGGLFMILFALPYALGGNATPDGPASPEDPVAHAKCQQLPGERDDTATRAPTLDPHSDRFDPAIDMLERMATLRRWFGWAGMGRVSDYNVLASLHERQGHDQDAFELYKAASDEGDMYGEFNVGRFYLDGKSPEKKPEAARAYFELAAGQNLAPAQYELGVMYADGIGVRCNISQAIDLWVKAGRQGNAAAIAALGLRDLGHAKPMLDLEPIDIDFANSDAVIKNEKKLMTFAAGFDAKRTLPEERRNATIEALRKVCSSRIDMIEKAVRASKYSQYDGLQSWHECYLKAESSLF